ncbi:cobalamin biosynthesis protein [Candidatus Rhodoblastus alkanivorans]|uniref:Cobalamin biosynthesis protein n=1 Tax=Candidatus Rhodoblastus alkanivorans TaxID=2954117 RepID=A0ABS9Z9D6_9HYPH|nr:cobalamin biosynthesis protein [Candidatus Rhodoblastus alkanivorans]MCI4684080.1 cobalamin biosynthesis protein [Candidatus Rhodoblastus alkanivorans]
MVSEIAIGLGFASSARAEDICALVRDMLRLAPPHARAKVFTLARKAQSAALREAAATLGLEVAYFDEAEMVAREKEIFVRGATVSQIAQEKIGLASVAEAAALLGAGPSALLLAPRRAEKNVTCALAAPADELNA